MAAFRAPNAAAAAAAAAAAGPAINKEVAGVGDDDDGGLGSVREALAVAELIPRDTYLTALRLSGLAINADHLLKRGLVKLLSNSGIMRPLSRDQPPMIGMEDVSDEGLAAWLSGVSGCAEWSRWASLPAKAEIESELLRRNQVSFLMADQIRPQFNTASTASTFSPAVPDVYRRTPSWSPTFTQAEMRHRNPMATGALNHGADLISAYLGEPNANAGVYTPPNQVRSLSPIYGASGYRNGASGYRTNKNRQNREVLRLHNNHPTIGQHHPTIGFQHHLPPPA
jgi:hypothetical protein